MLHRKSMRAVAACTISLALLGALALLGERESDEEQECPPGHHCIEVGEALKEAAERADARGAGYGLVPPGALRRAVEQKAALARGKAEVPNASGHWLAYGDGPLVQDQTYRPSAGNDGILTSAGRVDDFAWDPGSKRLFAAVGNGGIWMTQAIDGDVATLASEESPWRSISETLPSLVTSAVAWTPARGGRVIALTGEHSQGGNSYVGLGAYWTDDLGANWHHAEGIPDNAAAFRLAVDQSNPLIVYAATGKGLFRSADAGETFVNVALPTSEECAGVETPGKCGLANIVTDVVIRQPGGYALGGLDYTTCDVAGCSVLAAVGYRAGALPYEDGTPQSPNNGLYRSATGEPGTFELLDVYGDGLSPDGFASKPRTGRIELGVAEGAYQDHNVVYALVSDALLFLNTIPFVDIPTDTRTPTATPFCNSLGDPDSLEWLVCNIYLGGYSPSVFNGLYVSTDFGDSWTRLADDVEISYNPTTGSALVGATALGITPGYQSWYDLWVRPDPTQADPINGHPTRIAFGIEEVWKNRVNGVPVTGAQQTPNDFKVIGQYFAGDTCLFVIGLIGPPAPICPVRDGLINGPTSHPDQQGGIFIPDEQRGGVWLFAGNDGGVYKQYSGDPLTDDLAANKWADNANWGFHTLMHYGIAVAKDGTVYFGNQDNASGKIEPNTGRHVRTYIGDGVYAAVDPDNSQVGYYGTPGLSLVATTDGGITTNLDMQPPYSVVGTKHFLAPFRQDPRDPKHFVAAGNKVGETFDGAATGTDSWVQVFDLGVDEATGAEHIARSLALDVEGDAVYAGWCGPCNVLSGVDSVARQFQRGIATNVGGAAPPMRGTPDGWHQASLNGLPNRFVYTIEIDRADPRTVYVGLGGYSQARWLVPTQYEDTNPNIGSGHVFVSHDAGESFTDISGDLPDTVVTFLLKRGEQLIAGTDIGAFISSDLNGTRWVPLGDLPNVVISELVMDPADDRRLFAGTFGRGVQTYTFTEDVPGGGGGGPLPPPVGGGATEPRFGGGLAPWALLPLLGAALRRRRRGHMAR